MKLLITGANGFIGRHVLSKFLSDKKYDITITTRSNDLKNLGLNYDQIQIDLYDKASITNLFEKNKFTHLCHLAWYVNHSDFWVSDQNRVWQNITTHLLENFYENGGSHAFISGTCAEYSTSTLPLSENFETKPNTIYGQEKVKALQASTSLSRRYCSKLAWGRLFYPYGPGELCTKLIPTIVKTIQLKQDPPPIHWTDVRDYTYVDDIATAIKHMITNQLDDVYNISSGINTELREIYDNAARHLGYKHRINFKTDNKDMPSIIVGNNQKLRLTGWHPTYNISTGLEKYLKELNYE